MRSSKKMTKRFRNVKKESKRRKHKGGDDTTKSYTEIDENPEMNKMVKGIIGAEDDILKPERPFPKKQQNLFPSDYFNKMPERKLPKKGTYDDEIAKSHAIDDATIRAPTKPHPTGISVTEHPYYDEDVVRREASEQGEEDNYGGIEFGGKRKTKRRGHHKKPKKRYTKKHNKKQHKKYHKK